MPRKGRGISTLRELFRVRSPELRLHRLQVPSCTRYLRPSAFLDVTLPSWLSSSMISIWPKPTPIQGPELLPRSRRIIETPAYYTTEQGNLVALRQLYTGGRAGIRDSNPVSGRSTLFGGTFRGRMDVVRFLVDSGADMEASDFCGFTPRDLAFQRVNTACPPNLAAQVHPMFRPDEVPDDLDFTTAHRIVLGTPNLDLREYLSEHPQDPDEPDLLGRTPLWWAVRRDDVPRSHALLAHGANPSTANAAGRSPAAQRRLPGEPGIGSLAARTRGSGPSRGRTPCGWLARTACAGVARWR